MIKLSDYLNYLNSEVVQARKKADEAAVAVAQEYAKHEYLKYFSVPRFTMPKVSLNIPLKISELSSDARYNFKMDKAVFLDEVNTRIKEINERKGLNLPTITLDFLEKSAIKKIIKKLEEQDHKYVETLKRRTGAIAFNEPVREAQTMFSASLSSRQEREIMEKIIKEAFNKMHRLVSANLNDIYVNPDTAKESDKGKILITLDVEMIEEGIRIKQAKDKDGNIVEEIIFE